MHPRPILQLSVLLLVMIAAIMVILASSRENVPNEDAAREDKDKPSIQLKVNEEFMMWESMGKTILTSGFIN